MALNARPLIISLIAALGLTLSSTAWADDDDAPYSPQRQAVDDLLITEYFSTPPVAFPWDEVASERVPVLGRRDFALTYDVDYRTVRQFLEDAYGEGRDFIDVDADAMPHHDIEKLRIAGIELGQERGRIGVGHPDMEPMLTVDIEADGQYTRFIVQNLIRTRQFSGFMPSRVGFRPLGAEPLNFRNN